MLCNSNIERFEKEIIKRGTVMRYLMSFKLKSI